MLARKIGIALALLFFFSFIFSALPLGVGYGMFVGLFNLGRKIWPSALNVSENIFLTVMWLIGLLFIGAFLFAALRYRVRQYWYAILTAVCVFSLITLMRIPLTDESNQRWLARTLIEERGWEPFSREQRDGVNQIMGGIVYLRETAPELKSRHEKLEERLAQVNKLSELEPQSVQLRPIWLSLLQRQDAIPVDEVKQLAQRSDYLPEDSELTFAVGLLQLRDVQNYRPVEIIRSFVRAIEVEPNNPLYWEGLGLAYSVIRGQVDNSDRDLKSAYGALVYADYLQRNNSQSKQVATNNAMAKSFKHAFSLLSYDEQQNYLRLQARAIVKSHQLSYTDFSDESVLQMASLPLFVSGMDSLTQFDSYRNAPDSRYPGKFTVQTEGSTILPSSLNELHAPAISYVMDTGQVVVATDVNENGLPAFTLTQTSSNTRSYDLLAENIVSRLRFTPTGKPERHLVTIDFQSTMKKLDEFSDSILPYMMTLSKGLARNDSKRVESTTRRLTSFVRNNVPDKYRRDPRPYYAQYEEQQKVAKEIQKTLRATSKTASSNGAAWQESVDNMRALLAKYPSNIEVLNTTARIEFMYYNAARNLITENKASAIRDGFEDNPQKWRTLLLNARSRYQQIITIDPNRVDAWYAWGTTMVDEDPELAAGAFALLYSASDGSINHRLLMAQSRFMLFGLPDTSRERVEILSARMNKLYLGDRLPADASERDKELLAERDENALKVMPSMLPFAMNAPSKPVFSTPEVDSMQVTVDSERYGIKPDSLLLPPISFERTGKRQGEVILQIDVPNNGIPSSVLIHKSTAGDIFEDELILAAYHWRFKPTSRQKVLLIPVTFSDQSVNDINHISQ